MIPEPSQFSWENPGMARKSVMQQLYQDVSQNKSNAKITKNKIRPNTLKCDLLNKIYIYNLPRKKYYTKSITVA